MDISANPSYVWQTIKRFQSRWSQQQNKIEFKPEKIEAIKTQVNKLFPPWVPTAPLVLPNLTEIEQLDCEFTPQELQLAISHVNTKSSSGLDMIDYKILKNLPQLGKSILLKIYNLILTSGVFLEAWRNYKLFFTPKAGGKGLRPISRSSYVCKTMERMIGHRLTWWLESRDVFPRSQYGFRSNKSCIDNLALFFTDCFVAFLKDNVVVAAFLDVQSVYDNVLSDVLLRRLSRIGISTKIITFIYNLISFRRIFCQVGESDTNLSAFKGLPQGSVLSPILYNLYTSMLELENNCYPINKILQYADDICIYSVVPASGRGNFKSRKVNQQHRKIPFRVRLVSSQRKNTIRGF